MAIVETMKIHPEITLGEFNKEVARRIRIWTRDHFHACNGVIGNLLGDIEAQGFIKRRINEDKSETLLSDFDNKDCTKNEIVPEKDDVVSFGALEQAELDTTSSLQRLQAALDELRPDTDTSGHERGDTISSYRDHLEMAAEITAWALTDLRNSHCQGSCGSGRPGVRSRRPSRRTCLMENGPRRFRDNEQASKGYDRDHSG